MSKYEGVGLKSKLGAVITYDDHVYELVGDEAQGTLGQIKMQHNSSDPNGFTLEDLLSIALDRLDGYNKAVPDANNASAILGIQQALLHLRRRELNRKRAGVKGTDEVIPERIKPTVVAKRSKRPVSK